MVPAAHATTIAPSAHPLSLKAGSLDGVGSASLEQHSPPPRIGPVVCQPGSLPALPVEIIERILKFTFARSSPLIPSSSPSHLAGTTHILLVSRAIHELALPFLYHTLVLTRPSHYTTFFGSEGGLFVGPEGEQRWKHVREIAITHDLTPPPIVDQPPSTWLDEITLQSLTYPQTVSRLDRLCLLDRLDRPLPSAAAENLIALAQSDPAAREEVQAHHDREAGSICIDDDGRYMTGSSPGTIEETTRELVTDAFDLAAEGFVGQLGLLKSCRPRELHLSTDIVWHRTRSSPGMRQRREKMYAPGPRRVDRVVLHCASAQAVWTLDRLRNAILATRRAEWRAESLVLVDFPADVLEEFRRWKEKGFQTPPGPAHAPGADRAMFDRDQSWSWEMPDGTLYTMHTQRKTIAS